MEETVGSGQRVMHDDDAHDRSDQMVDQGLFDLGIGNHLLS